MSLTDEAVHRIRTAGMKDAYFSKVYGVTRETVRLARIGDTFKDHPTPPDTRERQSLGRYSSQDGTAAIVAHVTTSSDISRALARWPRCVSQ